MLECFNYGDPLVRIEGQHFLQKIQSVGISMRIYPVEWNLGFVRKRSKVTSGFVIEDGL